MEVRERERENFRLNGQRRPLSLSDRKPGSSEADGTVRAQGYEEPRELRVATEPCGRSTEGEEGGAGGGQGLFVPRATGWLSAQD